MQHSAKYNFTEAYNKLNAAQKQAVELTEGPVLVVAGPGTGKTQILAARIANILDKNLAFAENILCLTFTDAGVNAMRKRLIQFMGVEAYKVNIHTFHSFCNMVIQDNSAYFGMDEMEALSEIEEIELFEKLIDSFDKDNPLKRWRGDIYFDRKRLKNLFSVMKKEHFTAQDIEDAIESYIDSLDEDDAFICKRKTTTKKGITYLKGDVRTDKIEEERQRFEIVKAAAKQFENYQKIKRQAKRYDFDDMILDVLNAFENNDLLLGRYQEQFQYFLVDEYQDTNGSQNDLLKMLYSYWEMPNVFVVGDDDQSIFRFQGASMENIVQFFNQTIANLPIEEQINRVIVLKNNYRSTQEILNLAEQSIEQNTERLVHQLENLHLDKHLVAAGEMATVKNILPQLNVYPNASHEAADVVNKIVLLKEQGVPLNKIAVLYKNHVQSEPILQCLNQLEIPVNTKKPADVLQESFSNMLLNILQYIHDELKIAHSREDLLFNIMLYPFFKVKAIQVARLSFELRESRYKKPKTTWREALLNIESILDESSHEKIKNLSVLIDKWQSDAVVYPIQQFFQIVLDDIHAIEYVQNNKNKTWLMQELKTLFDFIKAENKKNPLMKLNGFIEILHQYQKYGIAVPFTKATYATEAVQFSSIHGAKGLEFMHVFVIGCTDKLWEKKRSQNNSFPFPPTLMDKQGKESELEELRRLFFVALTRAEKELYISWFEQSEDGKECQASQLLTEIKLPELLVENEIILKDEEITQFTALQMMPEKVDPVLLEENILKARLEKYVMSVTHLNNYLQCPIKFYYHNFIQVPQAKNTYLAFGTAVHDAIEEFFKQMLENGKEFPSKEEFKEIAMRKIYKQQDSFTQKEYEQKVDYLNKFLPEYYDTYITKWNKNILIEKSLNAVYKGVELSGRLDKIEFNDKNHIQIVDYKTGQFEPKKEKLFKAPSTNFKNPEEPTFEEEHGGNYWRQAVFYKILLENSKESKQKEWILDKTIFDFVEPKADSGEFTLKEVEILPQDIQTVKEQILSTHENILNLNFEGCGKADCEFCNGHILSPEED